MYILELIGVVASAVSGAMVAVEKKADVFGVLFLAVISALGGGVLRDMMLGYLPPRMFTSYVYIALALISASVVFGHAYLNRDLYRRHMEKYDSIDNVFDAVGLAAFTISGMNITIEACGMGNPLLPVLLGMTTGIGGGILRDVLTNSMPKVLRKRIYAVASMTGALIYYLLLYMHVNDLLSVMVAMIVIFSMRILATIYKWNMPRVEL